MTIEYKKTWLFGTAYSASCLTCGALVGDKEVHTRWHEDPAAIIEKKPEKPESHPGKK